MMYVKLLMALGETEKVYKIATKWECSPDPKKAMFARTTLQEFLLKKGYSRCERCGLAIPYPDLHRRGCV